VKHLKLSPYLLPCDFSVYTHTNVPLITSLACNCCISIDNRYFYINLICLPLSHLDSVLGMGLLSSNDVLLNCHDKILMFQIKHWWSLWLKRIKETILSTKMKFQKESQVYMILMSLKVKKISFISEFHVVS